MANISMKALLEAGVHFGHQTNKWNPKMKPYIFGARNGIYIIDLQQTVGLFQTAYQFIADTVARRRACLSAPKSRRRSRFKKSPRMQMPLCINVAGVMLTNFSTIKKSIDRLNHLDRIFADDIIKAFPRKEIMGIQKYREKLANVSWRDHGTSNGFLKAVFIIDP